MVIYLDYNSTTPCHNEVLEAMMPYFSERFGNASASTYSLGWQSNEAVKIARKKVAELINAEPEEIYFTSGATESINWAIKGVFDLYQAARPREQLHLITCVTEHSAVLKSHEYLEKYRGAEITYLTVNSQGLIDWSELVNSVQSNTILISVMMGNNETGVIQDVERIAEFAQERKIIFFTDTTQVIGKINLDVKRIGMGMCCLSGHKMYGPKGVGVLYISRKNPRISLLPLHNGGDQEGGMRSGTQNVAGIVGLGKASELSIKFIDIYKKIIAKRHKFELELLNNFDCVINGYLVERLPQVTNISFKNVNMQHLIKHLYSDLSLSLGSACNSSLSKVTHVLNAMGVDDNYIKGSVRFSMGIDTSEDELMEVVEIFKNKIHTI